MSLIESHDDYMTTVLTLIASTNLISPSAERAMKSDLLSRVAEGAPGKRVFAGLAYYEPIESLGEQILKSMLPCDYVDLRPISGSQANLIVLSALLRPGDLLLTVPIRHGGHVSMAGNVYREILGIQIEPIAYRPEHLDLDHEDALRKIEALHPKAVLLGGSVLIYEQQIELIASAAKAVGATVIYDAAHIAGFILTGHFPNPFAAGVDILTFTTCKTIPGPQHAAILAREQYREAIEHRIFPGLISGAHLHEIAGAIVALLELKQFGRQYIGQVLANARRLAACLDTGGLKILRDPARSYTDTHQILWDAETLGGGAAVEKLLEGVNILSNRNILYKDRDFRNPSGVRLGTQEVTRLGMSEKDMEFIAEFILETIHPAMDHESIRQRVVDFRRSFQSVRYCFDSPVEADARVVSG